MTKKLFQFQNSNEAGSADMKKDKDKGPASPYDNLSVKKDQENGPNCGSVLQPNGIVVMQNGGLDDEKGFKYVQRIFFRFFCRYRFSTLNKKNPHRSTYVMYVHCISKEERNAIAFMNKY